MREYYVYIMSSFRRTLYVEVTNSLATRVWQHKTGQVEGFTSRYRVDRLVYAESCGYVEDAITREKQIKKWRRKKKVQLILELIPEWKDLAEESGLVDGMEGQIPPLRSE